MGGGVGVVGGGSWGGGCEDKWGFLTTVFPHSVSAKHHR